MAVNKFNGLNSGLLCAAKYAQRNRLICSADSLGTGIFGFVVIAYPSKSSKGQKSSHNEYPSTVSISGPAPTTSAACPCFGESSFLFFMYASYGYKVIFDC
jgi:hypothetical protein